MLIVSGCRPGETDTTSTRVEPMTTVKNEKDIYIETRRAELLALVEAPETIEPEDKITDAFRDLLDERGEGEMIDVWVWKRPLMQSQIELELLDHAFDTRFMEEDYVQ